MIIYLFRYNFLFSLELLHFSLFKYHHFIPSFPPEVKPVSTLYSLLSALWWHWWVSRPVARLGFWLSESGCSSDHPPVFLFPEWHQCKESTCQCRRRRFDLRVRKIPWRRAWQSTPIVLPGESHGQSKTWLSVWAQSHGGPYAKLLRTGSRRVNSLKPSLSTLTLDWTTFGGHMLGIWKALLVSSLAVDLCCQPDSSSFVACSASWELLGFFYLLGLLWNFTRSCLGLDLCSSTVLGTSQCSPSRNLCFLFLRFLLRWWCDHFSLIFSL